MKVILEILDGRQKGRRIPLPESIFLIGRDRQCHLRPHCEAVSQLHCAIAAWGGKVRIRDFESRNGTLINGHPIRGEVTAHDGDELQVGSLLFALRVNMKAKPGGKSDESELRWLLEADDDSPVLSPGFGTWLVSPHSPPEQAPNMRPNRLRKTRKDQTEEAPKPSRSKSVSAGPQLRAQIEKEQR